MLQRKDTQILVSLYKQSKFILSMWFNMYAQNLFSPNAAAVRKEISDETDRITGKTKQISNHPIHLSIYSPNGMQ